MHAASPLLDKRERLAFYGLLGLYFGAQDSNVEDWNNLLRPAESESSKRYRAT